MLNWHSLPWRTAPQGLRKRKTHRSVEPKWHVDEALIQSAFPSFCMLLASYHLWKSIKPSNRYIDLSQHACGSTNSTPPDPSTPPPPDLAKIASILGSLENTKSLIHLTQTNTAWRSLWAFINHVGWGRVGWGCSRLLTFLQLANCAIL